MDTFTEQERTVLRRLAGAMIGASEELNLPGADDEVIFRDFLARAEGALAKLREGMDDFFSEYGGIAAVAALDDKNFKETIDEARQEYHPFLEMMIQRVSRSYYSDTRLLLSLNIEDRPPFPKGNVLEQGDWSLLNPVKKRKPFFRDC